MYGKHCQYWHTDNPVLRAVLNSDLVTHVSTSKDNHGDKRCGYTIPTCLKCRNYCCCFCFCCLLLLFLSLRCYCWCCYCWPNRLSMNETLYERRSTSSVECVNHQPFDNKARHPPPQASLSYLFSRYLSILIPFLICTPYHICSHYASSLVY